MKKALLALAASAILSPAVLAVEVIEVHGVPKPEFAVVGEVKNEDETRSLVVSNKDEAVKITLTIAGRSPVAWDFPSWVSLHSVVFGADSVLCMIRFDTNGLSWPICLMEIRTLSEGEGELTFYNRTVDDFIVHRLSRFDGLAFEAIGGFTKDAKGVAESQRGKYLRVKVKQSRLGEIAWEKAEEIKKEQDARVK